LELVEDVYAVGKDVLIVAGMDRDATAAAALALIAEM
jgi:S-layer protein (TIGR01564 family)